MKNNLLVSLDVIVFFIISVTLFPACSLGLQNRERNCNGTLITE